MSLSSIRIELESRLNTWANSFNPVIPVAYEGLPFQIPTIGDRYAEVFLLPASTFNPTVDGSRKREVGIFQVNLYVKDGKGTGQLNSLVDSLVAFFPVVPKTGNVSIERTPSVSVGMTMNGWRSVPVSIPYRMES